MDKYSDFRIVDSRDEGVKYLTQDGLKIYVMKIIPTEQYHNKEIEILKKLNELVDFVPRVIDEFEITCDELVTWGVLIPYFGSNRCKIMIYEYIDGQDLYDFTEDNILTTREINDIAFQMMKIVYKIHTLGIFHRDIKLENFVISPEGKVYLIDFGVSHQIQDEYIKTTMVPGSLAYVSREYVKMYKEMMVGKRYSINKINAILKSNDIYGLSVTIYTLYNEDFPYDDDVRFGDYDLFVKTLSNKKYKPELRPSRVVSNPIIMDVINLIHDSDYKTRVLLWNALSVYLK